LDYDPTKKGNTVHMKEYRLASVIQVLSFTCLMGPFFEFWLLVIPVCVIYSLTFWAVYFNAEKCDLFIHEAVLRFLSTMCLIVIAVYVNYRTVLQAYENQNDELLKIVERNQTRGLIIWKKNGNGIRGELIYCSFRAKELLGLPQTS
jgi:hypothetical protein